MIRFDFIGFNALFNVMCIIFIRCTHICANRDKLQGLQITNTKTANKNKCEKSPSSHCRTLFHLSECDHIVSKI